MDTSKEYIEMCRNKWIQELWEPNYFDNIFIVSDYRKEIDRKELILQRQFVFWNGETAILLDPCLIETSEGRWTPKGKIFWLPRQDQLQDMVANGRSGFGLHRLLNNWLLHTGNAIYFDENFSSEQLWLAFVMHEKFNKKWDGSEWK